MSDVWDDVPYVIVRVGPSKFQKVCLHTDDRYKAAAFGIERDLVDAPQEDRDEYAAFHVAAERGKRFRANEHSADRHQEAIETERKTPRKGRVCMVLRGNKVPVGTVGVCCWVGGGAYGDRLGLKVPGRNEPYWTAVTNCEAFRDGVTVEAGQTAAAMATLGCALLHIVTVGERKMARRIKQKTQKKTQKRAA